MGFMLPRPCNLKDKIGTGLTYDIMTSNFTRKENLELQISNRWKNDGKIMEKSWKNHGKIHSVATGHEIRVMEK